LTELLDLLRRVGFERIDVLHKHNCFVPFDGIRPRQRRETPL